MILISHRGNINGSNPLKENHPDYIKEALNADYDVEVDVWYTDKLMLGHDNPQYEFDIHTFLVYYGKNIWWHCKNIKALNYFQNYSCAYLNYFWHEEDTITLTSQNYIWAYPGKQPIKDSIAVMPEFNNDDTSQCLGICSDYIVNYKK